MEQIQNKYSDEFLAYLEQRKAETQQRSEEAKQRIENANQRIEEYMRQSAEYKRQSAENRVKINEGLNKALYVYKDIYLSFNQFPNDEHLRKVKENLPKLIILCDKYEVDYKKRSLLRCLSSTE